ncbi:MAG TPA: hypothetical protein VLG74_06870 [Blastocatellia bacterium]|nr:hypothetical protein [Blastocatellia bacterium]
MSYRVTTHISQALLAMLLTGFTASAQMEFKRPKPAKPLPNPSVINATRDEVLSTTKQMMETREIPLDKEDCSNTTGECTVLSKPVVFIKGIATKSQLEHYCEMPTVAVRDWARGRYVLRFQITPATPKTAQVGVYAKFEGMMNAVTGSEWVPLTSKGELEDLMLRCIQDRIQGGDCKDIFR